MKNLLARINSLEHKAKEQDRVISFLLELLGYETDQFEDQYGEKFPDEENEKPKQPVARNLSELAKMKTTTPVPPSVNSSPVKTMNHHDFTGYGKDVLEASLKKLGTGTIPGPLNIVRNALEKALKQVPEINPITYKPSASVALMRNLAQKEK